MHWTAFSLLWILLYAKSVYCLRVTDLVAPEKVIVGDTIALTCMYDLDHEELYSIKWYRNHREFFRYFPTDRPKGMFFPQPGIRIDLERSDDHTVILKDVNMSTSGEYMCRIVILPFLSVAEAKAYIEVKEEELKEPAIILSSSSRLTYGFLTFSILLGIFIW